MLMKTNFQFYNQVSPSYIEPLFLQIEPDQWYSSLELKLLLRQSGLGVEGTDIVRRNLEAWSLSGIGEAQVRKDNGKRTSYFRINSLGKQLQDTYSTNRELFFDLIHFLFYSAWHRSLDLRRGRFWLYSSICDILWCEAPSKPDTLMLASRLQTEGNELFPIASPTFPARAIAAPFTWLGKLTPPFAERLAQAHIRTKRRDFCTPQLFHLAVDLTYTVKKIKYGTSISMDEETIASICKVCLLSTDRFWEMADRAKMAIRGFEVRKGQFGTSVALDGPPSWIDLPNFTNRDIGELEEEE